VSNENTRYLELLEQRLDLLSSLAAALTAARSDLVSIDIDVLESRIADQQRLCMEICSLDTQLDRLQHQCAAHFALSSPREIVPPSDPDSTRLQETLDRLARAQASVMQLNHQHQALLRRSRRTVSALLNSHHTFAMTYSNPSNSRASAVEGL
jgi:flagellar biosynthesis/type III secretory pathway chaperone